jgi:hypothetical protein
VQPVAFVQLIFSSTFGLVVYHDLLGLHL